MGRRNRWAMRVTPLFVVSSSWCAAKSRFCTEKDGGYVRLDTKWGQDVDGLRNGKVAGPVAFGHSGFC